MGYQMIQRDARFRIRAENKQAALAAIKALVETGKRFAYVNDTKVLKALTLTKALAEWSWELRGDRSLWEAGDGPMNIVGIQFVGEYAGSDDALFGTLAPFVEPGSYIEMQGEEGERWRWLFDGETVTRKAARIVWD